MYTHSTISGSPMSAIPSSGTNSNPHILPARFFSLTRQNSLNLPSEPVLKTASAWPKINRFFRDFIFCTQYKSNYLLSVCYPISFRTLRFSTAAKPCFFRLLPPPCDKKMHLFFPPKFKNQKPSFFPLLTHLFIYSFLHKDATHRAGDLTNLAAPDLMTEGSPGEVKPKTPDRFPSPHSKISIFDSQQWKCVNTLSGSLH
jgi:hypothetical protein